MIEPHLDQPFGHVSVCGGRGRCSTCRVRVIEGLVGQPAPEAAELATLSRIGAPENVRLACQFRPTHNVTVVPILDTDSLGIKTQLARQNGGGRERRVAVLFCDLRDFTRIAEHKLPYDTVFLLNSYFEMVGEAVEGSGGVIDKFIGDGALAIFGLKTPLPEACRQALTAAARLSDGIRALNLTFEDELEQPLRLAIGLHDQRRDQFLRAQGITVLRFDSSQVLDGPNYVFLTIRDHVASFLKKERPLASKEAKLGTGGADA